VERGSLDALDIRAITKAVVHALKYHMHSTFVCSRALGALHQLVDEEGTEECEVVEVLVELLKTLLSRSGHPVASKYSQSSRATGPPSSPRDRGRGHLHSDETIVIQACVVLELLVKRHRKVCPSFIVREAVPALQQMRAVKGFAAVLDVMQVWRSVELIQVHGCGVISTLDDGREQGEALQEGDADRSGRAGSSIIAAMAAHYKSSAVQSHGCTALAMVAAQLQACFEADYDGTGLGSSCVFFFGGRAVESTIQAMAKHLNNEAVQAAGCLALEHLATDAVQVEAAWRAPVTAMKKFSKSAAIAYHACAAIGRMSEMAVGKTVMQQVALIMPVQEALILHKANPQVEDAGLQALLRISWGALETQAVNKQLHINGLQVHEPWHELRTSATAMMESVLRENQEVMREQIMPSEKAVIQTEQQRSFQDKFPNLFGAEDGPVHPPTVKKISRRTRSKVEKEEA